MGLGTAQRGASLVEYAIVAPLMLLLLFGVVESSRLAYTYSQVWTAAREGARVATTVGDADGDGTPNYLDCDEMLAAALSKAVGTGLQPGHMTVTLTSGAASETCDSLAPAPISIDVDSGASVDVEVQLSYEPLLPVIGAFFDGLDISSTQSRSVYRGVVGS